MSPTAVALSATPRSCVCCAFVSTMATPAVRSSALSLYRSYLRTAATMPRLQVRVSSRRAVRMAFRARAYDYLALLGGDGGTAGADAAADVWIREGQEDLGMSGSMSSGESLSSCPMLLYRMWGATLTMLGLALLLLSNVSSLLSCLRRTCISVFLLRWLYVPLPQQLSWHVRCTSTTDTWRSLTRLDPAMLNAILFPRADNDEAAISSNASENGQTPYGT